MESELHEPAHKPPRGFLNPRVVRALSFWITSVCVLVAVVASILAIWNFSGTDVLWRTVASCAVIGGGTTAFSLVNVLFGASGE
ncbi:MAG TPA: hypothetical protein VFX12_14365 [Vicinamibacterales bacterium]|nr:hypothetical protein [Vicinamibacterales bacterium]